MYKLWDGKSSITEMNGHTGILIPLACLAINVEIDFLIQYWTYVENLYPLDWSNLSAPCKTPNFPACRSGELKVRQENEDS